MKLFVTDERDAKCSGCGSDRSVFYGIGNSEEHARDNFPEDKEYGQGFCVHCIVKLAIENGWNITGKYL